MTTEHNNRTANGYANGITERGFIIERQEKRIAELEKALRLSSDDIEKCIYYCRDDDWDEGYLSELQSTVDYNRLLLTTTDQQGE